MISLVSLEARSRRPAVHDLPLPGRVEDGYGC
jgi:hypothetical protein